MKAIGIDLGTTNSAAAYYDGNGVKVLRTKGNEALTPSVVSYRTPKKNKEGQILVGQPAVNNAVLAPQDTIYSIKRLMGRIYDDSKVQELKERVGYTLEAHSSDDDEQGVRVVLNNSSYSPTDISSMILKDIKDYASFRLGEEVTHAVITVPAYFEERQRAATRKAGLDAGLVVKMIMSEPVAAALAFGLDSAREEGKRVLVFDMGGGTFDISIIQMSGNQFQSLCHEGDNWLGGDDFDKEIVNAVSKYVQEKQGFDPSSDQEFQARAKPKAQEAKIALGVSDEYEIIISPAGKTPDGNTFSVQMAITRDEFEQMITKYVDRCMELTRDAMRSQELTEEDISDVILVGGSTAVPLIQRRLQQEFKSTSIRCDIESMECVALGAAILAAKMKGVECPECFDDNDQKQHTINDESSFECKKCGASLASAQSASELVYYDVTPMHLGIKAVNGDNLDSFVPIITKGTQYPLQDPIRQSFYTTEENQKLIKVPVYEGLHDLASQNDQQGIVKWKLPEDLPMNSPIEVAFNYDRNRVLTVSLRIMNKDDLVHEVILQRDRPQEIIVSTADEEEIDWKEESDNIIPSAERFLNAFEGYMKEGTADKMRSELDKLRKALDEDNETRGRKSAHNIYMMMFGSAGVASQLYLAERAAEGAPPEVSAEIQVSVEQVRTAYEIDDQGTLRESIGNLKTKIARQLQTRMTQSKVGDKVDYEDLLRFKN